MFKYCQKNIRMLTCSYGTVVENKLSKWKVLSLKKQTLRFIVFLKYDIFKLEFLNCSTAHVIRGLVTVLYSYTIFHSHIELFQLTCSASKAYIDFMITEQFEKKISTLQSFFGLSMMMLNEHCVHVALRHVNHITI